MKNTKKVFSVALAGALAFGSMGASFAAAPEMNKETDKKITEAVERLNAFGIVNGMEDGKYHEEMKVTREQFAKILVEALGLGNAADAAKGATKFSDVEGSRWSAGYINVAQGQGLLSGYPDGTFQPAKEVSYAEAVTMLVRGLGYKDEFLPGTWPGNYVSKAADTGITDGANFSDAKGTADRGTVALLVDNALDANVVKVTEYVDGQIKYGEKNDITLLQDKLEIKEYKNVRLVGNERINPKLDSDEAQFMPTKDDVKFVKGNLDLDKDDSDKTEKVEVDIIKGLNTDELMGLKVKVYVNDDDEVVFMQRDGNEKVYSDVVTKVDSSKDEVSLLVADDDYDAENGTAYVTGKDTDKVLDGKVIDEVKDGMMGRFVVEGNEIVFADVMQPGVANGMVVKKVDSDAQEITGIIGTDEDETINLKDDYDKLIVRDVNGKALELKDIEENNVVYIAETEIDGDDTAVVTVVQNNVVKGKLNRVKVDTIEIDDKEYDLTQDYTPEGEDTDVVAATFSVNKGDDIELYSTEYDKDNSKLEDADDAEILAVKDIAGNVIYFTTDVNVTSDDLYGIVTKAYADGDKVKVYVPSLDKELSYTFEEDDDFKNLKNKDEKGNYIGGDFVKFSLNKDGEIADGEFHVDSDLVEITDDYGKDSIKTNKGTLSVSKDSVLISEEDNSANKEITTDDDQLSLLKWADLKSDDLSTVEYTEESKKVNKAYARVFKDSKDEIEGMVFLDGVGGTADDSEAAYVIETWKKSGDRFVKAALSGGEIKEYELDKDNDSQFDGEEKGYVVKVKSNGKLDFLSDTEDDFSRVAGKVYDKDGDYVSLYKEIVYKEKEGKTTSEVDHYVFDAKHYDDKNNNGKYDKDEEIYFKTNDNSVIYDEKDKKRLSNVTKNTSIEMIVEDGKEVRVLEIK